VGGLEEVKDVRPEVLSYKYFLIIFTKSDLDYLSISLLERMNILLVLLIGTH